jgi:N utilization substance protein A
VKNVPRETVFIALELALASATKKLFKDEVDVRVQINRSSGDYEAFRRWLVVPDGELDDHDLQIILSEARKQVNEVELGDYIEEGLEAIDLGRIGAQAAKQVILQRIRDAEREQIISDYLARNEPIVSGTVKRVDREGAIVESGKLEARLQRDQMIPKETCAQVIGYALRFCGLIEGEDPNFCCREHHLNSSSIFFPMRFQRLNKACLRSRQLREILAFGQKSRC